MIFLKTPTTHLLSPLFPAFQHLFHNLQWIYSSNIQISYFSNLSTFNYISHFISSLQNKTTLHLLAFTFTFWAQDKSLTTLLKFRHNHTINCIYMYVPFTFFWFCFIIYTTFNDYNATPLIYFKQSWKHTLNLSLFPVLVITHTHSIKNPHFHKLALLQIPSIHPNIQSSHLYHIFFQLHKILYVLLLFKHFPISTT